MYLFVMIILSFFAVIGFCAFIAAILDLLYAADCSAVLTLSGLRPDNAEQCIRAAARVCMKHKGYRLVCLIGERDHAYEICRLMQKDYPFLEIRSEN